MQTALASNNEMPPHVHGTKNDLDRLAEIAAALCDAPIAFVAAFDADTQWIQGKVGMDVTTTARGDAICGTVFEAGGAVTIPDLLLDVRTWANPYVRELGLRFYSGHPVRSVDGEIFGTVCVMDFEPRPQGLTTAQALALGALAEQAATIFGLRQAAQRQFVVLQNHERRERSNRMRIAKLSALVHLGDRLREAVGIPEVLSVAAETLGLALDALQAGCARIDTEKRTVTVENDWSRSDAITSSAGVHKFEDHPDIVAEMIAGRTMVAIDTMVHQDVMRSHMRVPVVSQGRLVGMVYAIDEEDREWTNDDREFARVVADRVHGAIEGILAKEQHEVMVGEVGHRMKNMMAVTRAIVMQTLSSRVDKDVVQDLDKRLTAYSGAHDLLLAGGGDAADLAETATGTLTRLSVEDRVVLDGPHILLNQRATLAFSLLVNELATNAFKHGSLSRPQGRVQLEWRIDADTLVIEWRERGGPPAEAPTRKGFGQRLLQMGLGRPGGTEIAYAPEGVTATFRALLREIGVAA